MSKIHLPGFLIRQMIVWGTALVSAFGVHQFVRDFTICWRLTSLPGIPSPGCVGPEVMPLQTPVVGEKEVAPEPTPTPEAPLVQEIQYPTWDGASRLNILFVGLRGGDPIEGDCPFCTDTLILLTVDPVTKTAGMLSIPRDMWVNIPGFGYSRINTAWTLGRGSKLPGGGPGLAMKTVSHFVGVPVNYYVQVDFDTFVDIIDMLGGVDIYNDETIVLDPMSHGKDFPKVKLTCCGMRHLNGTAALAFARCRHAEQGCKDGDVGRAKRQQKIIFGIREKVLDPENFTSLLRQAPQLYDTFSAGIQTNMSLMGAIKLAVMVNDIPQENIRNAVIDHSMMTFGNTILGGQNASVMKPIPDKIRLVRDQIFTASGPLSPMAQGEPSALMLEDGARIRLLNGTSSPELDLRTRDYLMKRGMSIAEIGNVKAQSRTMIVLYSPKLYSLRFLMDVLGITKGSQILIKPDSSQTVDIEIRLGPEWAKALPAEE
jgi:LCP family protein required for cell wall assembly